MVEGENEFGPEQIVKSIRKLEEKKEELYKILSLLQDLEEKADVYVEDPDDSASIFIRVSSDEPFDELVELSEVDNFLAPSTFNPDDIVYDPREEIYKLEKKIRTDR